MRAYTIIDDHPSAGPDQSTQLWQCNLQLRVLKRQDTQHKIEGSLSERQPFQVGNHKVNILFLLRSHFLFGMCYHGTRNVYAYQVIRFGRQSQSEIAWTATGIQHQPSFLW
jgi:hypothetical protein